MDIKMLQDFFLWCMIINFGIYTITSIAVLVFRNLLCKLHEAIFSMNEESTLKSIQKYLSTYKLLITIFNFVPWIAIILVK